MGIHWLAMAQLSRSVTGLDWGRFGRAHAPSALLAVLIGLTAAAVAHAGRAADLGNLPILVTAALASAVAAAIAAWMQPALFLGPHGTWAFARGRELFQRGGQRASSRPDPEELAQAAEASSQ
jgi:hypothetical protein